MVVVVSIHGEDRVALEARLLASGAVPDVHLRQFEHPFGSALVLLLGVRFFGLLHDGDEAGVKDAALLGQEAAALGQLLLFVGGGQEAVVAHTPEAQRQQVQQEAADELQGGTRIKTAVALAQ